MRKRNDWPVALFDYFGESLKNSYSYLFPLNELMVLLLKRSYFFEEILPIQVSNLKYKSAVRLANR